ncbi:MAG: 50S ribosomal protein L17 [Verrucomicrobia bacterium]|nr:50S ribosomal protein L17 [Verrucomicrobiota bacterium]
MRHGKRTIKLGRKSEHRNAMLANLVCSLILHGRVRTTVMKAKAARRLADRVITFGKKGTLHHRRLAVSALHQREAVAKLFKDLAPQYQGRSGGYTRIVKLNQRIGDSAPLAFLEWVETAVAAPEPAAEPAKPAATS